MSSLQCAKTVFTMFYTTIVIAFTSLQLMGFDQASSQSNTDVLPNAHYFFYQNSEYPKDCREVQRQCSTQISRGVYLIKPDGFQEPFEAFCDNGTDSGGWTVIQRREDGIVNFNRSWTGYRDGFGFLSTEFFIGNEKLAYLTNQADYELLIKAELEDGCSFYTSYKGFRITDEFGQYTLQHIGSFEGNASLCLTDCPANEFFINECTEKCVCSDNNLVTCRTVSCDDNAVCDNRTGVESCSCKDGFEGDGLTCTEITTPPPVYTDCKDVFDDGNTQDGVYTIFPNGWTGSSFNVSCDMSNGGGGWTVFQRRKDDSTSFYRDWNSYKEGFGGEDDNFWLGNEKLFHLTNQKNYRLRLDIVTSEGTALDAEWDEFQIQDENDNYRMNKLGTRSTTSGFAGHFLFWSRNKQFSTHDRDNDRCDNYDCAEQHMSGWWHSDTWCWSCFRNLSCGGDLAFPSTAVYNSGICTLDNLNGDYEGGNGVRIFTGAYATCDCNCGYDGNLCSTSYCDGFCGGSHYSPTCSNSFNYCNPQRVELKIRPSP